MRSQTTTRAEGSSHRRWPSSEILARHHFSSSPSLWASLANENSTRRPTAASPRPSSLCSTESRLSQAGLGWAGLAGALDDVCGLARDLIRAFNWPSVLVAAQLPTRCGHDGCAGHETKIGLYVPIIPSMPTIVVVVVAAVGLVARPLHEAARGQ